MRDQDHLACGQCRQPRSRARNLIDKTFAAGRPAVRRRLPEIPVGVARLGGEVFSGPIYAELFRKRYLKKDEREAEWERGVKSLREIALYVASWPSKCV